MGSMSEQLIRTGLVAEPAAEAATRPATIADTIDSFSTRTLEWASAALELIGRERLVTALRRGLEGTNQARGAFDGLLDREISRFPRAQADGWRARLPRLGGSKGCPTFCSEAQEVLEAVTSGAADAFATERRKTQLEADALVWPESHEDEEEGGYRARLEAWAADKPEHLLRAARFDSYRIAAAVRGERDRRKREREMEASRIALDAFERTGDLVALRAAEAAIGTMWTGHNRSDRAEHIAGESRHAWALVRAGLLQPPQAAPPPEEAWLSEQTDVDFLLRCSQEARYTYSTPPRDHCRVFREALFRALPVKPDEDHVLVRGTLAIDSLGRSMVLSSWAYDSRDGFRRFPVQESAIKLVSTTPHPDGWVTVRPVKEWGGERLQATLYGPENWRALEVASQCRQGALDVRAWMPDFGVHKEKGFGRFYFRVQPGGASWDQMFISVDDRLRERILLLQRLPDPDDVAFPPDVWWIPARLTSVKDDGGHLVWDETGDRKMVAWKKAASWVQMSRRSSGTSISHRQTSTAPAWSLSASTAKHNASMVVSLIGEGQALHLSSGLAVRLTNGVLHEVPGGALSPLEAP